MAEVMITDAFSMYLGDGYELVLSEKTGVLKRMPQGFGYPYYMGLLPEEFLRQVGFTINNRMDVDIAYDIVVHLFKFITYIDYEHFKSIVKTIDTAIQEKDRIGLYF